MPEIVDVYEMTPVQAGMLFHSLRSPDSGMYFQQYWCRLEGALNVPGFRAAWDHVIAQHDILRSQCHWENLEVPAHVILDQVTPDWALEDWRQDDAPSKLLDDWLIKDRARGFDLGSCPLMRFALMRMEPDAYFFVWSFHHLLIDGWSGAVLVREMLDAYGGEVRKTEPGQFRDYADWLAVQDQTEAQQYWSQALDGLEGPTPLGIDQATPATASGVVEHRTHLSHELTQSLTDMVGRNRLTLNTVMQGVWGLILSRYCGQGDVCFGTVLSGRPPDLPGVEDMIGLFLTTVPTRVSAEAQSLLPWLQDIQNQQRQRERFGHVSLTDIQRWSGQGTAAPLFDSLLIVETYPQSIEAVADRDGAALRMRDTGMFEHTNYPLTLKILPGATLELCLTADATRLTNRALRRLAGHFEQVLQSFVSTPDQTLNNVRLLSQDEKQTQLTTGRGPDRAAAPLALDQIVRRLGAESEATAICTLTGQDVTNADAKHRVEQIAAALAARGVGRGDVVAVCQDRTPDMVFTLLAIWRVGAAYVPLDPIYPADRIAYILADCGAALVVVDACSLPALGAQQPAALLDVADCDGAVGDGVMPQGEDLAYILYTSGSTGQPKGVKISHKALANFLVSMYREPGIASQDRVLALTTVSFDIAALELFGPLYAGAVLVLGDSGLGADGKRLAGVLGDYGVTIMQATPSGWRLLIEAGWSGQNSLKMLAGGEALDASLARQLLPKGRALWNLYGPTETTIWSAALRISPQMVQGAKTPVGGPLDNTQLYVLDRAGHIAPIGVSGELLIGGDGLSSGYHDRPDLTADRFIPDHLNGTGRLYRTGDNVRWSEDGSLEFLGRLDDQVKLRGYRIELGEVEAQLETHPSVHQAVAMVRDDGPGERLAAYVRPADGAALPDDLRKHLSGTLPDYMIPTAWVTVDTFPLTPNGKINRRALPAPDRTAKSLRVDGSVHADLIASIWCDVLGVAHVGPEDTFFDLGGHSLLATRLIGAVGQAVSVDVTLRDLFDAPAFADFCTRVTELQGTRVLPPLCKTDAAPELSFAQHRQWILAQFNPSDTAYLLPLTINLNGPLDVVALRGAFTDVATRHDVLRSSFPADKGRATVRIHPANPVDMPVTDLTAQASPDQAIRDAQRSQRQTPFDISVAPPWRLRLLRKGQESHVLLITLHHILADEGSFAVLLHEVSTAYAQITGQRPSAPPAALQYADYAAWQRGLDLSGERDYWRWQLEGAPAVLALPTDFARTTPRQVDAGRIAFRLDPQTSDGLRAMARAQGATVFICLLAAYAVLLHRHTDEDDLVIGTPVSNRNLPDTQGMIGLFVNTLAIRVQAEDDLTFSHLIEQVRETVLAAHANQNIPFEQVIEALDLPRSDSHAPLVQTLFSMQSLPEAGELLAGLTWTPEPADVGAARFDLSLSMQDTGREIVGHFDYAADLFSSATVERIARRFTTLLGDLAGKLEYPIHELAVLPEDEQRQMAAWSSGVKMAPMTVEQRLAFHNSDAVFCDIGGATLTYGALRAQLSGASSAQLSQNMDALIATIARLLDGPGDVSGAILTKEGLAQLGAVPLPAAARLEWDGTLHGSGLVQVIAVLCSGATLVDHGATAWARSTDDGFAFDYGGQSQRFYSPPELPMALSTPSHSGCDKRLGHPQPNVMAYVLHRSGQLAPVGTVGELCLGGAALARGYTGDPGRTADSFRPNPHVDPQDFQAHDACLWHSGLLVRRDETGTLHVIGSLKEQIRIAGHRVSPDQIEDVIRAHPAVDDVALIMPDGARQKLEAALVLQLGSTRPADSDMTRHILQHLPDYLIPRRMHWVTEIKRLADGQLDHAALTRLTRRRDQPAPQGPVEVEIADLWAAVLQVDTIGRHDNFFELGGDSILAMQIVARMTEVGYQIEPRLLFFHQTVASLSEVVQKEKPAEVSFDLPELDGLDLEALAVSVSFGDAE